MIVSISGRTALITGAASGLGRAVAVTLAQAGARVVICDIDDVGAAETLSLVERAGGSGIAEHFDVTSEEHRRDLFVRLRDESPRLDILVNVAGIDLPGYLHDVKLPEFQRVNAVNYEGPVMLMSEFLRQFPAGTRGPRAEIVNIVSISAITVGSGALAYNSSKAAFAKATEIAQRDALEFGYHCRIQGIMPAAMDTPMMHRWGIPADRMMAPEVVATEVLNAVRRDDAAYAQNLIITPVNEPDWPR
jgi:NAD(P)-dependent dehydrogenase (short-subunit alcohol dehydrogenase family)